MNKWLVLDDDFLIFCTLALHFGLLRSSPNWKKGRLEIPLFLMTKRESSSLLATLKTLWCHFSVPLDDGHIGSCCHPDRVKGFHNDNIMDCWGKRPSLGDPNLVLLEVAGRAKLKAAEKGVHLGFREQGVKDKWGKFSNARNVCLRKAVLKHVRHKMHL